MGARCASGANDVDELVLGQVDIGRLLLPCQSMFLDFCSECPFGDIQGEKLAGNSLMFHLSNVFIIKKVSVEEFCTQIPLPRIRQYYNNKFVGICFSPGYFDCCRYGGT